VPDSSNAATSYAGIPSGFKPVRKLLHNLHQERASRVGGKENCTITGFESCPYPALVRILDPTQQILAVVAFLLVDDSMVGRAKQDQVLGSSNLVRLKSPIARAIRLGTDDVRFHAGDDSETDVRCVLGERTSAYGTTTAR
jgi:hypothetical protein